MGQKKHDFSGWATKNDLKCSDGRTIKAGAFKHADQTKVPLVWQHQHNDPETVLGHVMLQNQNEGVRALGFFNDTPRGQHARMAVEHGDVNALSIFANNLTEQGKNVLHGDIKEVSLVLAGANPGALIDDVLLRHADDTYEKVDGEAIVFTGEALEHADAGDEGDDDEELTHAEGEGETVADVIDTMNDKQKNALNYLVGEALASKSGEAKHTSTDPADPNSISHSQEENNMSTSRNVFENNGENATSKRPTLSHDQIKTVIETAEKTGSLREAFLQHGSDFLAHAGTFGINDIDILFPEAHVINNTPEFIKRRTEWVNGVLNGVRRSPFSKIKTLSADITHDEARALGYIKGTLKKEEFFGLKSRKTGPTTIYKKQKLDRDDIIDVTTLDVVAWVKQEMRIMLDEEIAGAILVGDGRDAENPDKIKNPISSVDGDGIRAIATEDPFYAPVLSLDTTAPEFSQDDVVDQVIRTRALYEGSGNPVFYTSSDTIIDLMLQKDSLGHRLYKTEQELAAAMRVSRFVEIPQVILNRAPGVLGIIVNLADYTVGADKGGQLAMFDDFDIDFNQYKYLMETRISGALTKYRSAIIIKDSSVVVP